MDQPPPAAPASGFARVRAFYELTKPGIAAYVMITAGVSAWVASRGHASPVLLLHTVLGTGMASGGALALNQYVERDEDSRMVRTRNRPIPSGRLESAWAAVFGALLLAGGLTWLGFLVGWEPAVVAGASALMYHAVYTPLKSRSYLATLAGGVPGALPTLIGWTAARGSLELGGFALFAIAYLWQLPHVLGLSWMLRDDYARVGFKLSPPHDDSGKIIGLHMVLAASALVPVSLTPALLGYTGTWYFGGALILSGLFAGVSVNAARRLTDVTARSVFFGSLLYHPLLLGLMLLNTVRG